MSTLSYQDQALGWQPESKADRLFIIITATVVVLFIGFALTLSTIELPEPERQAKTEVPERIAEFILAKEKPKPKPEPKPEPKPKPEPIIEELPEPEPEPKVQIKPKKEERVEPLTDVQRQAREKAQNSGLLALSNELSDIIDTTSVAQVAGSKINKSSSANEAATVDTAMLNVDSSARTTAKVDDSAYTAPVSSTALADQQRVAVSQTLVDETVEDVAVDSADTSKGSASGSSRSQEDINYYISKNRRSLDKAYRTARRSDSGLQGKIVFEITILPSGEVSDVKIKSSELNNPALERRLVARIKGFNFGVKEGEPMTVIFPVEFLPY